MTELSGRELLSLLDEELLRLPDKYREPLLLCYLEGLTRDEAAGRLGCPLGTLKSWLERGRDLLGRALTRRGIGLSAALAVTLAVAERGSAAVPPALLRALLGSVRTGVCVSVSVSTLVDAGAPTAILTKAKVALVLLLAGLVSAGVAVAARQKPKIDPPLVAVEKEGPPHADGQGDALPAEAVARLGTLRFRHGDIVRSLAFTPGGKQVVSHAEESIRVWEAGTGREVGSILPRNERWNWDALLTRDGRRIVSLEADSQGNWSGQTRRFLVRTHDRASLKLVGEFGFERTYMVSRFSPDGKYFALVAEHGTVLELWDVEAGKLLRSWQLATGRIWGCRFSPDGKTLITTSDEKVIRFWDVPSGKPVRAITNYPDIVGVAVPSPDGSLLATVAMTEIGPGAGSYPHAPRVRLWDVAAGKEVRLLDGRTQVARFGVYDVAFAPDGKTLAAAGPALTVGLWDVASGKEKHRLAIGVDTLAFSPDGATLAVGDGRTVRVIDVASGKEVHPLSAHQQGIRQLSITPDGRTALTGVGDNSIRLWDAKSGRERGLLEGNVSARTLRTLGDGRTFIAPSTERSVRRWDLKLPEPRRLPDLLAPHGVLDVTPDGKIAVSSGKEPVTFLQTLILVDMATGKELHRLADHSQHIFGATFSPDGRTLVVCDSERTAHIWDVASGRKLRLFSLIHSAERGNRRSRQFMSYPVALTPNARLLAYGNPNEAHRDRYLALYDPSAGKFVRRLDLPDNVGAITFTPDSRMLAWGGWIDPAAYLVEVATGQERHVLWGHKGRILSLTFSADARTLVSGSEDTTALVWNLAGPLGGPKKETTPPTLAELEAAWADLGTADGARAYRGMRLLAAAPAEAVPYLRQQLRPIVLDEKHLARLIADLDSSRFVVREKVARELEDLGSTAEPALRKILAEKPSLEMRKRIENLLEQDAAQGSFPTPHRLQQMRALEVLELAGESESHRLLKELAGGTPGVWRTEEARTALGRLALRRTSSP